MQQYAACDLCHGFGRFDDIPCMKCDGAGIAIPKIPVDLEKYELVLFSWQSNLLGRRYGEWEPLHDRKETQFITPEIAARVAELFDSLQKLITTGKEA